MHHKHAVFPFAAIVGQETMKKALILNAIDPGIGGVLIRGDKGTGKSTAVRALADLLPEIRVVEGCPFNCDPENQRLMCRSCKERYMKEGFLPWTLRKMEIVDMPLSATEDMVVGTIDIKRVLKEGIKALEPGILARANRNILYIDEVNLLDDHLVNILLDAAAMGVNVVEREGISLYHPSRFILVGTMNPEEGQLRPQLMDRFGLCVEVNALENKEERLKVMEYRRLFDSDPWLFEEMFREEQERLRKSIIEAQSLLPAVEISEELLLKIVEIVTSLGIRTHRADIAMEKTSKAIAALSGRNFVIEEDVLEAALLALPHRMRRHPFEKERVLTRESVEAVLYSSKKEDLEPDKESELKKSFTFLDAESGRPGRDFKRTGSEKGLYVRATPSKNPRSVAVDATLRKAIRETGRPEVLAEHLMEKVRISKGQALHIIVVDTSSSMRLDKKIKFAKTLSWLLLKQSYERKSRVALYAFNNGRPELVVEPTSDYASFEALLESVPVGGKTPLTPALYEALKLAKSKPECASSVIVISDGRANLFMNGSLEADLEKILPLSDGTKVVFVNTESRSRSIGVLEGLAEKLGALHFYLEDVMET